MMASVQESGSRSALVLPLLLMVMVGSSACRSTPSDGQRNLEQRDPRTAHVAHSYGWQARTSHPQPQWHPSENIIVVRGRDGLGILREGPGGERYVALRGGQQTWDPKWWGHNQVVFGPGWRPTERGVSGFTLPSGGLLVADVVLGEFEDLADLYDKGYAPQPWGQQRLFAQYGEDLLLLQRRDNGSLDESYFGKGFFPVPQTSGPGLTYQVTPYPYHEYWTGLPGAGTLIVRWRPGQVDSVEQAYGARWTGDGQVLATLRVSDDEGKGSRRDVIIIPSPGEMAQTLAVGAHSPSPHPTLALAAVADNEEGIRLVSYDREVDVRLSRRGSAPQWSADGSRLLIHEPRPDGPPFLRVLVVVWRGSDDPSPPPR